MIQRIPVSDIRFTLTSPSLDRQADGCLDVGHTHELKSGQVHAEPLHCALLYRHAGAHRALDSQRREWLWWRWGNDRTITRLAAHPVLPQSPTPGEAQ